MIRAEVLRRRDSGARRGAEARRGLVLRQSRFLFAPSCIAETLRSECGFAAKAVPSAPPRLCERKNLFLRVSASPREPHGLAA